MCKHKLNRDHYEGTMDRFQTFKAKRKLFFEENDDINDQGSKLVRHYMNRSVIAEEDECEISGTYNMSHIHFLNLKSLVQRTIKMVNFIHLFKHT